MHHEYWIIHMSPHEYMHMSVWLQSWVHQCICTMYAEWAFYSTCTTSTNTQKSAFHRTWIMRDGLQAGVSHSACIMSVGLQLWVYHSTCTMGQSLQACPSHSSCTMNASIQAWASNDSTDIMSARLQAKPPIVSTPWVVDYNVNPPQ